MYYYYFCVKFSSSLYSLVLDRIDSDIQKIATNYCTSKQSLLNQFYIILYASSVVLT